eukprot:TRINITY_DN16818_c0_g1_i1.p6 TRINITY_DN16818_c0_g1~~TRINITY_DN16818_c0_g1_i1.p6  ORF type:complete len:109 (+),score=17.40 TRINITY_DN16818_c0_g1_i1:424-750(+)
MNGLRLSDGADPRRADPTHMPAALVDVGHAGRTLAGGSLDAPPPPSTVHDVNGDNDGDAGDTTEEDEEEVLVRWDAHAGSTARPDHVEEGREEDARAAAAQVLHGTLD